MPFFQIEGKYYEAGSYVEAKAMHAASKTATAPVPAPPAPEKSLPKRDPPKPKAPPPPSPVIDAPVVPVAVVDPVPAGIRAADMLCYRGEKSAWWPPPHKRLICGMTVYEPWNLTHKTMPQLWAHLVKFIDSTILPKFNKPKDFAQFLRAQGRPYALATARSTVGSFTSDYNYVIKIPGARTFRWNKNLTLGAPANFIKPEDIDGDYIVLNADTIADSTILGFGHHCGTGEVTFFHDLPLKFVETVDSGKGALPVSKLDPPIMKQEGLKMDERIPLLKYLRR